MAALCKGLLFRKVYKTIDLSRFEDPKDARRAITAVERVIAEGGGEPGYELFYDQPSGSGYETFAADTINECGGGANEILVKSDDGNLTPFGELSPISRALNRQLQFRRLHVAPQWRERAEAVVKAM